MIDKIYFDMDGVLADFDNGVRRLCGMFTPKQDRTENDDDLMWAKVREGKAGRNKYSSLRSCRNHQDTKRDSL